ncbi:MAG: hypothetical protein IJ698_05595 [Prevotella sp.]|nr:hypothetical protein [Prevotella sp.]
MKREAYIKPTCDIVPLFSENRLMEYSGLTGAKDPLGKQTDYEEADSDLGSWEYDVENPFGQTYNARNVWEDFSDYGQKGKRKK